MIQHESKLLFGVCYFRQILSEIHPEDKDISRSHIQKAVCVISEYPLFGSLLIKLEPTTHAYFHQINFRDTQILQDFYLSSNQVKTLNNIDYAEFVNGLNLNKVIEYMGNKIFILIKLLLLESRIVVYGSKAGSVTTFILSVLALFPGNILFKFNHSNHIKNYLKSINSIGMPLRIFNSKCRIFPLFTLNELDSITKYDGFFMGTTNQLIPQFPKTNADCIINLDTNKFDVLNEKKRNLCKISNISKKFIESLTKSLNIPANTASEKWINFERPLLDYDFQKKEDYIRSEFSTYFKLMFAQIVLAKQCFYSFESLKLDLGDDFSSERTNSEELKQEEVKKEVKKEDKKDFAKDIKKERKSREGKRRLSNKMNQSIAIIDFREDNDLIFAKADSVKEDTISPNKIKIIKKRSSSMGFERSPEKEKKITLQDKQKIEKLSKANEKQVKKLEGLRKKAIYKILKDHDWKFIKKWSKTYNFQKWTSSFDIKIGNISHNSGETYANNINYENGDIYVGAMYNGKRQGEGMYYDDLTQYTYNGGWLNDMKNGHGNLASKSGDYVYDGEWLNNKKHGQGKFINKNGMYSGSFINDQFNGNGVFCDSEGNVYEGEWLNGKKHGIAHYKSKDGDQYVGEFRDNNFFGNGQMSYSNGDVYSGLFENGQRNGYGNMIYKNATSYQGYWQNDTYSGTGMFTQEDGNQIKGEWNVGILDESKEIIINYTDGEKFVGFCKNREPYSGMVFSKTGDIRNIGDPTI